MVRFLNFLLNQSYHLTWMKINLKKMNAGSYIIIFDYCEMRS